jgi:DNA-binding Lrp family transcriptional regulator
MTDITLEIKTSTGFRLESEMFRPVMDAIPEKFPAENRATRVLREAAIGNVIPDLLIGQWEADDHRSVPQLTNIARHVLALLQRSGPSTIESIQSKLYLSESALARAISVLRRAGALSQVESRSELHVPPDFAKRTNVRLIAIEMKMKRWREALEQAIRYLSFADEAYVVLDGDQVDYTHEMRRAFELAAPGLYFQHGTDLRKVLDCAPAPPMPSADRLLAMQKLRSSGPHCFA